MRCAGRGVRTGVRKGVRTPVFGPKSAHPHYVVAPPHPTTLSTKLSTMECAPPNRNRTLLSHERTLAATRGLPRRRPTPYLTTGAHRGAHRVRMGAHVFHNAVSQLHLAGVRTCAPPCAPPRWGWAGRASRTALSNRWAGTLSRARGTQRGRAATPPASLVAPTPRSPTWHGA